MKCYTWQDGELTPGIIVERDPSLGIVVSLGRGGYGTANSQVKVELYRKNRPEIVDGRIYEAQPVNLNEDSDNTHRYYMLAKPDPNIETDQNVLVRINTLWVNAAGDPLGEWETIAGAPRELGVGYGSSKIIIIGNVDWHEGIVLLAPGDAVCITPEGASEIERYVLYCDKNGLHDLFFSEYRRQFADKLEEVFI